MCIPGRWDPQIPCLFSARSPASLKELGASSLYHSFVAGKEKPSCCVPIFPWRVLTSLSGSRIVHALGGRGEEEVQIKELKSLDKMDGQRLLGLG